MTSIRIPLPPYISGQIRCDRSQLLGVHAIEPGHFAPVADMPSSLFGKYQSRNPALVPLVDIDGKRIAIVRIDGILTKWGFLGDARGSMLRHAEVIAGLGRNDDVDAIILVIDSPGGTVAGTADLANVIHAVRQIKPVVAYVEDLAASAAYWIASQCTAVYVNNETALVGSIGVFVVMLDMSKLFTTKGVETIVIRSGPQKGVGVPGDKITDEQRAMVQLRVEGTAGLFIKSVAQGRKLDRRHVVFYADGSVFGPTMATEAKLIDGTTDFNSLLAAIAREL